MIFYCCFIGFIIIICNSSHGSFNVIDHEQAYVIQMGLVPHPVPEQKLIIVKYCFRKIKDCSFVYQ